MVINIVIMIKSGNIAILFYVVSSGYNANACGRWITTAVALTRIQLAIQMDLYKNTFSLTGKYGDVIMVGLVQSVVYDALFIREAFEYIHTHLNE